MARWSSIKDDHVKVKLLDLFHQLTEAHGFINTGDTVLQIIEHLPKDVVLFVRIRLDLGLSLL